MVDASQTSSRVHSRGDVVFFDLFRLDPAQQRLWRGSEEIPLRPKAFALLCELVQRPGQLITKKELLEAVWPGTSVSDAVLKVCISEIRRALGDRPGGLRFIETRHRRGYRLVPLPPGYALERFQTSAQETTGRVLNRESSFSESRSIVPSRLVGRDTEMAKMRELLARAIRGERRTVFISGEAGAGKTTLVDAFLDHVADRHGLLVGRGQCVEHRDSEPFQPVLEALSHLCRRPGHDRLVSVLATHAPTWLSQMPWVFSTTSEHKAHRGEHAAHARMIREMVEAMERIASEWGLVFVLEDMQWADDSTLDLLASLARPREPAALFVIGTCVPFVSLEGGHSLRAVKQELQVHMRCIELPLAPLTPDEIAVYIENRFPGTHAAVDLAAIVHSHTEGTPLFAVGVLDAMLADGVLVRRDKHWELTRKLSQISIGVPEHIHQALDLEFERLATPDRRILEAGSVVGLEFSAAAVAAALEEDALPIEERCETLVRRGQYLQSAGISRKADGKVTAHFRFTHAFYQRVFYQRILPRMRMRWHLRITEYQASLGRPSDLRQPVVRTKRRRSKRVRKLPS